MNHVVTMGGGSGHSQVLKALKSIPNVVITGICPSTDSGGSTGVLQKEYNGTGYTGDLTKCVTALCNDDVLTRALSYRYDSGSLQTHSVKNVFFHALQIVSGTTEALETFWKVCGLGSHRIIPVIDEKAELCATLKIGNTIFGEANIDTIAQNPLWNPEVHSISELYLKPEVNASALAIDALTHADYIIICPGDLYSSVIPSLLPTGVKETIQKSKANIILILNIMTKKGETDNYTAKDFIEKTESYLGRTADYIIANSAPIPSEALLQYSLEQKVECDSLENFVDSRILSAPLVMVSESGHVRTNPGPLQKVIEHIFSLQEVKK